MMRLLIDLLVKVRKIDNQIECHNHQFYTYKTSNEMLAVLLTKFNIVIMIRNNFNEANSSGVCSKNLCDILLTSPTYQLKCVYFITERST